jgi:2-polyprenyl-3-methyl-5-hydroxy-6-metoxy-1,4-benzoquinol methylase
MDDQAGVISGNVYNKYESRNPLARAIMWNFTRTVMGMVKSTGARQILDVGCGEGYFSRLFAREGIKVKAVDVSDKVIEIARSMTAPGTVTYEARGISALSAERDRSEMVAGLEIMEHVTDPEAALDKIASLAAPYVILSVPNEPLWRILNMARGRYLTRLGNTPGHLQHWSPAAFERFVSTRVRILEVRHPLPWTVILGRV